MGCSGGNGGGGLNCSVSGCQLGVALWGALTGATGARAVLFGGGAGRCA